MQAQDSADLTQEVFATLFKKLPEFHYDRHKSFRAWLRALTLNHWRDLHKRVATRPVPGDEVGLKELTIPAEISVLEEMEYRQHLIDQALQVMQTDFQPATWQGFWEHGVNGRPAETVAHELGISLASVYGAKFARAASTWRRATATARFTFCACRKLPPNEGNQTRLYGPSDESSLTLPARRIFGLFAFF